MVRTSSGVEQNLAFQFYGKDDLPVTRKTSTAIKGYTCSLSLSSPPPREKDKLGTPTSLCTYQPVYTHEKQLQLSRDTRLGIIWHLTNKWLIISTLGTLKEDKFILENM